MALMRVAPRPILILVATMLVVGGVITPAPASEETPPELARLQWEIDILIDRAVEYRENGEYEYGISKLRLAIYSARRAMQEFGVELASFYRLNREAYASVVECTRALDAILYQMDSKVRDLHVNWLDDPSVLNARQVAESLQSVPGTADGLVLDLRIDLRAYVAALYSQPIRKYLEPEAEKHLQSVVETIGQEVGRACRTGSLDEARGLIEHARFRGEEVIEGGQAAKSWTDLVYNTGMDIELAGQRATDLRQRVEKLDRDVAQWESALAALDSGEIHRLEQVLIEAKEILLPTLLEQTMLTVEFDDIYGQGLNNLILLRTELYYSHKEDWNRDWDQRAQAIVDGVMVEIENFENLIAQVERSRAVLRDLRIWIDQFQGPDMLGDIDGFLAEAYRTVFDLRALKLQVDSDLERGRQCVEDLARGSTPSSTPPAPITSPAAVGSPLPTTPTPPPRPIGAPPPPHPVATSPPPSSIQPDVAGGLKITGPSRIGVGWTVTLVATDHGGRPAVGVSWYALSDNIQLHDDGTVKGLAPGSATVLTTVDGMRAFFDFEVVADGGATAAPGGPPALATPLPDAVVVPAASPTPIPVPPSTPPTPADARTTDWGDPAPSSWESDEDGGSRVDDASPTAEAAGRGGGFEDLGTEVGGATDPAERSSPAAGVEAPSLTGETTIGETAGPDTLPRIPDAPESTGGFEDLGVEVGRSDDQAPPADPDQPGQGMPPMGAGATEPSPPQAPPRPPGPTGPPPTGQTGSTSDEPSTTPPPEPAGLNFMGVEVGQIQYPEAGPGDVIPLLPPPGSDDSRASGTPPPGSAPPPPDDDRRPFVPQRVNVTGAGQPAAYHIFATCSRLGWAGALARYSVGPADTAIADHLLVAGEHAMWANRTSYPPTPAWPDWQARRGLWGGWAAQLAQTRDPVFRGQMANSLTTAHEPLAQSLAVQTVGDTYRTPSCDAEYCRLGFLMAWGQQALAISEEANRNGNSQVAQAAAIDGQQRLRLARDRLPGYQRITPASGRCADLAPIGGQLEAAISGRSTAAARAAWETALRAIMALGTGQPPPSGGSLLGAWVLADGRVVTVSQRGDGFVGDSDGREIFRVRPDGGGQYRGTGLIATQSGSSESSRWYDGLTITVTGDTANATIGQFSFSMTRTGESAVRSAAGGSAPVQTEPSSELEGYWQVVDTTPWPRIYEVRREGDSYVRRPCVPPSGKGDSVHFTPDGRGGYTTRSEPSGRAFDDRNTGTRSASQERYVVEYQAVVSGDEWHEESRTYDNFARHHWSGRYSYRRVALQGQCGRLSYGTCQEQLCPMCPRSDSYVWLMGVSSECQRCIDAARQGKPNAITQCVRANATGRAVPLGTPGSIAIPGSAAPQPIQQGQSLPRSAPTSPSQPTGEINNMQMMGVEGPGDTRAGLERAACEAAGLTQANCCGDWNGPCPDGTTGCHRVWRCD